MPIFSVLKVEPSTLHMFKHFTTKLSSSSLLKIIFKRGSLIVQSGLKLALNLLLSQSPRVQGLQHVLLCHILFTAGDQSKLDAYQEKQLYQLSYITSFIWVVVESLCVCVCVAFVFFFLFLSFIFGYSLVRQHCLLQYLPWMYSDLPQYLLPQLLTSEVIDMCHHTQLYKLLLAACSQNSA